MAAPKGNNYAGNALVAKKALERVLAETSGITRKEALEEIWYQQITKAMAGDNDSAKFIVERLDGKATQVVDAKVDASLVVELIRFSDAT